MINLQKLINKIKKEFQYNQLINYINMIKIS